MLPHLAGVVVDSVKARGAGTEVWVSARSGSARCSHCGNASSRVHSRYQRTLADAAIAGRPTILVVRVRRFFCDAGGCHARTFAEQINGLTSRYARRTPLVRRILEAIGLALAGRAGARLAATLGIATSRDSLLRLVRAKPDPPIGPVAVAGVDDFALRKRLRYATVVLDMDTLRPVDVLADRRVATTAAWLREHPHIRIVCRDGSASYAEAIKAGAPKAVQVSDRWHLWKGLAEAALKEVASHSACWAKTSLPAREGTRAATTRERWQQIHHLLDKGVGLLDIARRLNLGLNTVKRYARMNQPERLIRAPAYRPTLVDPYREHLRRRRADDPAIPVTRLLAEIKARGYRGSANLLVRYLNQGRAEGDRPPISPRGLTGLILTQPDKLTASQRQIRDKLVCACPEMIELTDAVREFAELLNPREGNENRLQDWITTVRGYDLPYLHALTRGLEKDRQAVTAGLTLPHSNGPTEGHVNRIKMIKRQMYGRANLDLLRKRILLT